MKSKVKLHKPTLEKCWETFACKSLPANCGLMPMLVPTAIVNPTRISSNRKPASFGPACVRYLVVSVHHPDKVCQKSEVNAWSQTLVQLSVESTNVQHTDFQVTKGITKHLNRCNAYHFEYFTPKIQCPKKGCGNEKRTHSISVSSPKVIRAIRAA